MMTEADRLDVRINNQSLRELLAGPPKITDQLNAICRTLEIPIQQADGLSNYLGQPIELWYNSKRWFIGFLMRRGYSSSGDILYKAYDPLFYLKKCPDDWYFKNATGNQIFKQLADACGIRVNSLANTGAVFNHLYYQNTAGDAIASDILARTYKANGKKFWYRYQPNNGQDGLILFEKTIPPKIWAFQIKVNLTAASYEEGLDDETVTVVKLVNRETGKLVIRTDKEALQKYGHLVYFEEIDKDKAASMEKHATDIIAKSAKPSITMGAEGINPDQTMPQFYSGDLIYVEEPYTGLIGAYYLENVTHTFESDTMVRLNFDLKTDLSIPEMVNEDSSKKAPDKLTPTGNGMQQEYSKEVKALMNRYGI